MSGKLKLLDHATGRAKFDVMITEAVTEYAAADAANDEQACGDAFNKMLEAGRARRRAQRPVRSSEYGKAPRFMR